jgi:hypothetical protein
VQHGLCCDLFLSAAEYPTEKVQQYYCLSWHLCLIMFQSGLQSIRGVAWQIVGLWWSSCGRYQNRTAEHDSSARHGLQ